MRSGHHDLALAALLAEFLSDEETGAGSRCHGEFRSGYQRESCGARMWGEKLESGWVLSGGVRIGSPKPGETRGVGAHAP